MKNLKIGIKLLITFMIIIILYCATVVTSIWGLRENADKYSQFYNVGYQITNNVMNMRRGLQASVKNLAFITITDDQEKIESFTADLQKELSSLQESANWLSQNFTGDTELLNTFFNNIEEATEMQNEVLELDKTDQQAAQKMLIDEYQPLVEEVMNLLIQISDMAGEDAEADYSSTVEMQDRLVYIQLAMAGGALFLTIVLSLYLTRGITKPLREIEDSAEKIVDGNFNFTINYKSKDELGMLADAFRNMTAILNEVISDASRLLGEMADGNFDVRTRAEERYVGEFRGLLLSIRKLNRNLSATLGQINRSADQVAAGSDQVSIGAQALSQGSTEQAAAVEELATTIAGISTQVKDTAEDALQAKKQSTAAGDEAEECNQQMHDMMNAMEEITRTSDEIGKIIKTIEDIAFQTNILALNAAVEASRAGTAGKGFAVVADEVRNLASKSSVASQNTAELIESSIKAVSRGTQIADSTAQSLVKVVEEVRSASGKVDKIADAAEEQAGAIEQVTLGINQISSVVQTNSATSEQSAAASQELSEQADMLKQLVAKFILRAEYALGSNPDMETGYDNKQQSEDYINLD